MIFNHLLIALRRLGKQKLNTALHIIGLTLGMSVCLLIGLFLRYELSFDTYHDKAVRTFRINSVWTRPDQKNYSFSTPIPLAEALRTGVAGLENVALAHPIPTRNSIVDINPEKRFIQEHVLVAEPEFVDIFNIEVLRGDAHQALGQPYQALLTETTAKKFFGEADPIGKTFLYKNEFSITVAGLIRDLPANTHLPASMLLSYVPNDRYLGIRPDTWTQVNGTSTFVVLPENYDLKNLETQLKRIADQNINAKRNSPQPNRTNFEIQALSDIHFNAKYGGGGVWVQAVETSWLWFFGGIAFAVLLLACINFVNLSTAQALTRAKEVGVRKVIGAGKFRLIIQFLGEAWILACMAGIFAVAIAQASLPAMNSLLQKEISFDLLQSPELLAALLIGIFLTGLFAGIYPAWVITKFNPIECL